MLHMHNLAQWATSKKGETFAAVKPTPLLQAVLAVALDQAVNLAGHRRLHLLVQDHEVTEVL